MTWVGELLQATKETYECACCGAPAPVDTPLHASLCPPCRARVVVDAVRCGSCGRPTVADPLFSVAICDRCNDEADDARHEVAR